MGDTPTETDQLVKGKSVGDVKLQVDEKPEQANGKEEKGETAAASPYVSSESWVLILRNVLIACCMGLVFGLAFEKSRVFEPESIRGQMIMRRFIMLKIFLAAVATSSAVFLGLCTLFPDKWNEVRQLWQGACDRGVLTAVVGGSLLIGVGFACSGACPGMVLSQVGSGVEWSGLTLLGGLVGAGIYGLCESYIRPCAQAGPKLPADKRFVDDWVLTGRPAFLLAGLLVGCVGGVVALELVVPWDSPSELSVPNGALCSLSSPFQCRSWPAWVGGIMMGCLHILSLAFFNTALGSATAYQSLCASPLLLSKDLPDFVDRHPKLSYLAIFTPNRSATIWQVLFLMMVAVGMVVMVVSCGAYYF